jgi:hypothetical protein
MTSSPCNGELRFWERVPSELMEIGRQLKRIADVLESVTIGGKVDADDAEDAK